MAQVREKNFILVQEAVKKLEEQVKKLQTSIEEINRKFNIQIAKESIASKKPVNKN
jgi:archaellum component FlaC